MRVPFTAVRSDGDVLHSLRSMLVPWGLAIALITTAPLGAIAAPITWGSATTISGDGDVSTTGTLLYAYNFGPSSVAGTTVNGVTFAPFALPDLTGPGIPVTVGGVSISESPGDLIGNLIFSGSLAPFTNLSSSYRNLLTYGATGGADETVTLQLGGLTPGHTYDFQWWSNDSSGNSPLWHDTVATATNSVTLLGNADPTDGSVGQFAIGRFTADATTLSITFDSRGGGSFWPLINGFQVRVVSSPVPEIDPAGFGSILALVSGALGLLERRRSRLA